MKTSKFYTEERASVVENMEAIVDSAKVEGRELTEGETTEFDSLNEKANSLEGMAKRAASFEALQANKAAKSEPVMETESPKEIRDYSFQEAIKAAHSGNMTGLVKEMHEEALNEARYSGQSYRGLAIPSSVLEYRAQVGTDAGNATEFVSWTDQLQNNLVLMSAGANFYSGVDNQKFGVFSAINSGWVDEAGTAGAPTAAGTAGNVTLTPKKCISIVNVSAEAMTQNAGIEAALRRNMAASVAASLESALLGAADVTNAPTSIFLDAATQAVAGAAPTAAELLNMEATLLANGVQLEGARMAWLLDPAALAESKVLAQVSSVSPIYDNRDKTLAGYFAFTSASVGNGNAGSDYLLGDFSKVHIAQFGGLDILVDPYTDAGIGQTRMIVTSLVDGDAVQNDTAFVKIANA
jgi:HK97 family phage major capsid protein